MLVTDRLIKPLRIEIPGQTCYRTLPFSTEIFKQILILRNLLPELVDDLKRRLDIIEYSNKLLNEALEDLFPDLDATYRPHAFLTVYCESMGIETVPVKVSCSSCGKSHVYHTKIKPDQLTEPVLKIKLEDEGFLSMRFSYTDKVFSTDDIDILKLVDMLAISVEYKDEFYKWSELTTDMKSLIIDRISYQEFEELIKTLSVIKPIIMPEQRKCCENTPTERDLGLRTFQDIFRFIFNAADLKTIYQADHIMVKSGYSLHDISLMAPMERSIFLKLISMDMEKKSNEQ